MTRFFINSYQREWRHKSGINTRYNSTPEEIGEARNLRRQGYCLQDIADMLGKKLSTIGKQCRDIKVGYAPNGSLRLEARDSYYQSQIYRGQYA